MKSIFIQIASYRDTELVPTIKDLISKSSGQNSLFFGICWQRGQTDSLEQFNKDKRFRIHDVHWSKSVGLGWARMNAQQLYNNEDYVLQIDSHSRFIKNWDTELINMLERLRYKSEKPLLTTYGTPYEPNKKIDDLNPPPYKLVPVDFKESGTIWFKRKIIEGYEKKTEPINARFIGGGFFFTYGSHCLEYKYDPQLYFAGDELTLSLRSYTMGYDLYHPHVNILWHFYKRVDHIKHWNDHNKKNPWWKTDKISKKRLNNLLEGQSLGNYGCGQNRSIRDYEMYAGFDFKNKRILKSATEGLDPPKEYSEEGFKKEQNINIDWKELPKGAYNIKLYNLAKKNVKSLSIDRNIECIQVESDYKIMKYDLLQNNQVIFSKDLNNDIVWN